MTTNPTPKPVSRRRVVQGIAWTTPAVVATVAAPAYAASPNICDPALVWNTWLMQGPVSGLTFNAATQVWTYIETGRDDHELSNSYVILAFEDGTEVVLGTPIDPEAEMLAPGETKTHLSDPTPPLASLTALRLETWYVKGQTKGQKVLADVIIDHDSCTIQEVEQEEPLPESCDKPNVWADYFAAGGSLGHVDVNGVPVAYTMAKVGDALQFDMDFSRVPPSIVTITLMDADGQALATTTAKESGVYSIPVDISVLDGIYIEADLQEPVSMSTIGFIEYTISPRTRCTVSRGTGERTEIR